MTFAKELERFGRFRGLELADTYAFRFRRRYLLPPTDPRFLLATEEEMVLDYWAHRFLDDPELRKEMVNPDYEDQVAEMERELLAAAAAKRLEAPKEDPPPAPEPELPPAELDPGDWDEPELSSRF